MHEYIINNKQSNINNTDVIHEGAHKKLIEMTFTFKKKKHALNE